MGDIRHKNQNWRLPELVKNTASWDCVNAALLMDIRDELQQLNRFLICDNAQAIPGLLRKIEANTRKKEPKRKAKR